MKPLNEFCLDFFEKFKIEGCDEGDIKCLSAALNRFLDSGKKDDAFDVYFCFAEIFQIFGKGYSENTKHMLELVSEYEMSAGTLVEKSRDHYVHSVFCFAIGLAIYAHSPKYRRSFKENTTGLKTHIDREFIYRWGLSSLFHDIGYPFEIVFDQIREYTMGLNNDGLYYPLVTYRGMDLFSYDGETNINVPLSNEIAKRLKINAEEILEKINGIVKTTDVPIAYKHDGFGRPEGMDHGYFGAVVMYKNLLKSGNIDAVLDIAASILLHNGPLGWQSHKLYTGKFSSNDFPLAFLLTFCDVAQDYGREGFGKVNLQNNLAYTAEFDISEVQFHLCYIYDKSGEKGAEKRTERKRSSLMFLDVDSIFDEISFEFAIREKPNPAHFYMSAGFFRNLLTLAMQIHASYLSDNEADSIIRSWDELPLEFKLSNIAQAKAYSEKLGKYGYFYDDRNLHYEVITGFTKEQTEELAFDEHTRWVNEKLSMGWKYGEIRDNAKRLHPDLIPYESLSESAKNKDRNTITRILENLGAAGFKVYKI